MFDFVRQHTRLVLGALLLLIIPSFIFFGVEGYTRFMDAGGAAVVTVERQKITRQEWDDTHRRAIEQARRGNPVLEAASLDTPELRRETLDRIVRERVLSVAANELHLAPTAARMARLFDADPQYASLRGPDGRISRELLAMQGMSPEMFDQRFRQELAARQVLDGVLQTAPVSRVAADAALDAFLQRREVQFQRFDPAPHRAKLNPGEAEIEAYYKANTAAFRAPEQASIEYVVLDLETIGRGLKFTDDELKKAYADSAAKYSTPEERRASHILIKADSGMSAADRAKAKERAEALRAEAAKNPSGFAELARKNSSDTASAQQGGDLDFFGRGAMVKPFEDAAFALRQGEVSAVVESEFGYHVILLTGTRGGERKPFEAVRAELEAELRKSRAGARWSELAENFTNTVYEQSDSLQPLLDKFAKDPKGAVVLQKQTATVQRKPQAGATGALASGKLLDAVFSNDAIANKRNTDAVEFGSQQLVSARVVEHKPERALGLAEVRDRVREKLLDEQAAAAARKEGQAREAALKANPSETLPATLVVGRTDPQGMPPNLLDVVLRADPAKLPVVSGVDLGGKAGYVVMRVTRVLPREPVPGGEERLRAQVAQAFAAAEAEAYLEALKTRHKVQFKPAASSTTDSAASAPRR